MHAGVTQAILGTMDTAGYGIGDDDDGDDGGGGGGSAAALGALRREVKRLMDENVTKESALSSLRGVC